MGNSPMYVHTTPAHAKYDCVLHLLTPYMVVYYTHSHHIWLYMHTWLHKCSKVHLHPTHAVATQHFRIQCIIQKHIVRDGHGVNSSAYRSYLAILLRTCTNIYITGICTNFTQKLYITAKNIEQMHSLCSPTSQ